MVKGKERKEKVVKVELLRVLACLMVIMVHIRIQPIADGQILKTTVFINCILSSAVGLFLLVTGFFFYGSRKSFWQVGRHFLLKILAPTLFLVMFTLLFEPWILGQTTMADCIEDGNIIEAAGAALNGVLRISSDYWGILCGHLWYIAEYGKLILLYPIVAVLIKYADTRVILYLTGFNVFHCLAIDLCRSFGILCFVYSEPFILPSQALVLIGCVLYQNRQRLKQRKWISAALLCTYGAGLLWMFYLQMRQFKGEGGDWSGAYFTTWLSGIGMLMAIILAALVLSLPDTWKLWDLVKRPITFLGGLSFPVYLIQYAVIIKMGSLGINDPFLLLAVDSAGTVSYYLLYGLFVFSVSVLLAFFLRIPGILAVRIWRR